MDKNNRVKDIQNVTIWGAICNIVLTIIKFVAGIFGGSAAMIADAIHSLSDLGSDVIVIVFARISTKGQDKGHDYGHGKFETLATVIVSILLLVIGAEMLKSSYDEVQFSLDGNPLAAPDSIALWAALASIISKEILYQWTARVGKRINSQVVIANAWHHRTDALSSIGSMIGIGGAILLGGKWTILDPLVGGIISIVIIAVAVKMALPAISELTETSLPEEIEQRIVQVVMSVEGIDDIHELKTRRCGSYSIADFHIVVDPQMTVSEAHDKTVEIESKLRDIFGKEMQLNIHIEPSKEAL